MIICVSLNPAIDRRVRLERLKIGAVNRAHAALPMAGGKAAHVALASKVLSSPPNRPCEVVWLGLLGGATGDIIERDLAAAGVSVCRVQTRSETRENLEIIDGECRITEILEPGGRVEADELGRFFAAFEGLLKETVPLCSVAVFSGSLPPGASVDVYAQLIELARKHKCQTILDTSGEALRHGLQAGPDLVKPNREEAEAVSGIEITGEQTAAAAALWFIQKGSRGAAVSLGAAGQVYVANQTAPRLWARPPQVEVVSTVGCGDAAAAGYAWALWRDMSKVDAARLAATCGTANCLAEIPGRLRAEDLPPIGFKVRVDELAV